MGAAGSLSATIPRRVAPSANGRRRLLAAVALLAPASWPSDASAKTKASPRVPVVALVYNSVPLSELNGPEPIFDEARGFRHALRDLGWTDGRNVMLRFVSAEGRPERLPGLMDQLVADRAAVIVATGNAAMVAKGATRTIPIVALIDDAQAGDFVDSLSRPRGNVTAITSEIGSLTPKRLELLNSIAPHATRVAVLNTPRILGAEVARGRIEATARALGVTLAWIDVERAEGIDAALAGALADKVDAIVVEDTQPNFLRRQGIAAFAIEHRLPTVFPFHDYVEVGGLMAYEADPAERTRRAAVYVDKILRGTKPADLPVDQPSVFNLVVNLKTARALGLAIPTALQLRITRTIE